MLQSGELTEVVTLQQKSVTRNAIGDEVVTWPEVATVWAKAVPLRGREFFAAAQMQSSVEVRFLIYYRTDLTVEGHRLVWRGVPYDIRSIIDIEARRVVLEIMCASGVHDAR